MPYDAFGVIIMIMVVVGVTVITMTLKLMVMKWTRADLRRFSTAILIKIASLDGRHKI